MIVVAAPDKFRGSATAGEVAQAVCAAVTDAGGTCRLLPLADGGEGTLEALGGGNRSTTVTGPLGDPVQARWRLDGDDAVVEMSRASGLALVGGAAGNDPLRASTRGTGELVAAALAGGARRVVVAVGGSATTDGGRGAVEVLEAHAPLGGPGAAVQVEVACDVATRFVDAAAVFAPQKGADPEQVTALTHRLERLAADYLERYGVDVAALPGSGAAGGLAGGLAALGARLVPGFALVADRVGLADALAGADLVVTGEGRLDPTSYEGKVVGGVLAAAAAAGVPALVVCGDCAPGAEGGVPLVVLLRRFGQRSWTDPLGCVREAVAEHLAGLAPG